MLWPGEPNGMYHSESVQEDFLVVAGECLVSEVALKHGAGVEEETALPSEAYARFPKGGRGPAPEGALPAVPPQP